MEHFRCVLCSHATFIPACCLWFKAMARHALFAFHFSWLCEGWLMVPYPLHVSRDPYCLPACLLACYSMCTTSKHALLAYRIHFGMFMHTAILIWNDLSRISISLPGTRQGLRHGVYPYRTTATPPTGRKYAGKVGIFMLISTRWSKLFKKINDTLPT